MIFLYANSRFVTYNTTFVKRCLFIVLAVVLSGVAGPGNGLFGQPASSSGHLRFTLLTDLHVTPGASSEKDLENIVGEINSTETDFVVVTGDLSNSGSDAELTAVRNALSKLRHKCYVIPGNHETNWAESAGLKIIEYWGSDRFTARHNGFLLTGFSTGPFMKMGDGLVKQEDVYWLRDELGRKKEDETLVAFAHYPLAEGLSNWFDVTSILKSAGCRLVFCGHGHSLRLYNFDGIPGIMCRSVILGKSTVPGYNIIDIRNDSVFVYNKPLGAPAGRAAVALNYMQPDTLSKLQVSPMPDYSINTKYKNYRVVASFRDSSSIFTGPCIAGALLVYGNSAGFLKAVDRTTGSTVWRRKLAAPVYSTPVYAKGLVIVGSVEGKIHAFDARSGKEVWVVRTGRPALAEGITDGRHLFIGGGDSEFFSINIKKGRVNWTFPVDGLVQGGPALSSKSVFFGAWDRHFYCIDRKSGKLKWKWTNGKPQVLYSPGNIYPVASNGRVFIVAPDRFMTAIDEQTGKEIWRTGRHTVRESMGASPDGSLIYAKLMNDTIIAVSALDESAVTEWKIDAGFGYEHNPCPVFSAGNGIYVGTRDGVIVAMDKAGKKVMWKYRAGNSAVNRFAGDSEGIIWCTLAEGVVAGIKTIVID